MMIIGIMIMIKNDDNNDSKIKNENGITVYMDINIVVTLGLVQRQKLTIQ